ncbi:MAG TPA: adenosine deaminase [bacterium]|nr:adenosine deaminase [bacterium]HPV20388.1 adenosine deaminase [bacterium]HQM85185.1 adenosine deaminase [bacterium]
MQSSELSKKGDSGLKCTEKLTSEFFRILPKTDLHVHLDGSLRLETILELAKKEKIELGASNVEELKALIGPGKTHKSLNDYLKGFDITLKVLQTREGLYRAAYELCEDCASENIEYFEVRYSPVLHTNLGLPLPAIVESVVEGLKAGQRDFKVNSGVIICGIRNISPEVSLRMAELAVAFKNRGVVGFDLAGAEYNYPARDHLEAFSLILSNNVNVTIHAGEAYGPESIHQALHYCGAHRIGHGVRLREDGDLLNYVNDHRIPLELCPSSNVQTGAVRNIKSHPLKFYLDLGIRATINTDNRLITDTTMSKEYELIYNTFNLTCQNILDLVINGIKSSFMPFEQKKWYLRDTKSKVAGLIKEHTGMNIRNP